MRAESFDVPPVDGKVVHQFIDDLCCVMVCIGCQMGVLGRGQDGAMAQDFLHFQQIDAHFDQVSGIAESLAA